MSSDIHGTGVGDFTICRVKSYAATLSADVVLTAKVTTNRKLPYLT